MAGESVKCPHCGSSMEQVDDPDITYERCARCDGIFLDKGELNVLATGMGGDIEFCSVEDAEEFTAKYPPRPCPKCPGRMMKKEDLLIFSDLVFDYCEACGAWFLDRGELKKMNDFLGQLRKSQGGTKEARYRHRDHLVTVTQVTQMTFAGTGTGVGAGAVPATWHRIDVYYKQPLGLDLRMTPETWGAKLWKLFTGQDIKTGDAAFDGAFLIKTDSPEGARRVLSEAARKRLMEFSRSPFAKFSYKRTYEILDDRVVFSYSDWGRKDRAPKEGEREKLIDALVEIAEALGTSPAA